jgi:hypothetical protein
MQSDNGSGQLNANMEEGKKRVDGILLCTASWSKLSLMLWVCNAIEGVGIIVAVNVNINASKYIAILEDCLWPVGARHFPANSYVFQVPQCTGPE